MGQDKMKVAKYRVISAAIATAIVSIAVPVQAGATNGAPVMRRVADYVPPSVSLIDSSGRALPLGALLNSHHAVILEFFFTSCSTICGIQTSALAIARPKLGRDVAILSITIDPEYDTPIRLRDYGVHFGVGSNWHMLTGRSQDIAKVLTAFQARPYGDNKMYHRPYVFIRPAADRQWIRLEGLMNGDQLAAEFRQALSHPSPPSVVQAGLLDNLFKLLGK